MRFAYADPPYPGCAHLYPENTEVDHVALIERLRSEFPDGWALSTNSTSLAYVLNLWVLRDVELRIGAWVKPFASFKPNVNPAYAWEPVIFFGGRKRGRDEATVRDWLAANITMERGLVGAKPAEFCHWILDLLGYQEGDEMIDLFPGTGAMSKALAQSRMAL